MKPWRLVCSKLKSRRLRFNVNLKDDMPDPGEKIIAFVEELDKAREYLSFTGYLRGRHDIRHDSDEILTFKSLVQHERVHERFTKLYFEDIMNAVQDHILDLQMSQMFGDFEDIMNAVQDHILDLQMSQMFGEYLEICGDQIRRTPIFNLVYRVLEEGYIADMDPLAELHIIEKSHPLFYQNCFVRRLREKYSEKIVVVRNVPITYQEIELKAIFSDCGDIESVTFERDGEWHQIAYVTFGSSEGAKLAPILMGRGENSFCIRSVTRECRPPTCSEVSGARKMRQVYALLCSTVF